MLLPTMALILRIMSFFITHRLEIEVASIGAGAVTIASLEYVNVALKITVSAVTLVIIIWKAIYEYKKSKTLKSES